MEYQDVVKKVVEEIKINFPEISVEQVIDMIWNEAKYENLHHPVRWKGRSKLEKTVRELV
jgi:uncharacterized protein YpuA (DUF1002 family)